MSARPPVLILHAPGTNRDREAAWACELAGAAPEIVHVNQLCASERRLADYRMLVLPGGFSYGDDLGAGKLWAVTLRYRLGDDLAAFIAAGRPVLGICNGFQALVKAGLLSLTPVFSLSAREGETDLPSPGRGGSGGICVNLKEGEGHPTPRPPSLRGKDLTPRPPSLRGKGKNISPPLHGEGSSTGAGTGATVDVKLTHMGAGGEVTLARNDSARFECRWVYLAPQANSPCIFTRGLTEPIYCPVAHGEGKFVARDAATLARLEAAGLVALRYVGPNAAAASYPWNPNGSQNDIAGICNAQGNVLGLMPHPEDHIIPEQHPRYHHGERGMSGLALFRNGVKYAAEL